MLISASSRRTRGHPRLTVNYGIRYILQRRDHRAGRTGGRFVPAVTSNDRLHAVRNDVTPRFGVAYDCSQRADRVEGSAQNTWPARRSASRSATTRSRRRATSGVDRYERDDIAQDNEIAAIGNNLRFGQAVLARHPDADIAREYDWEYSAGIHTADARRLGVTAAGITATLTT